MKYLGLVLISIGAAFVNFAGCAGGDLSIAENVNTQNKGDNRGSNNAANTKGEQMKIKIGSKLLPPPSLIMRRRLNSKPGCR